MKATPEDQNLLIELQLIDSQITQAKVKLAGLPEIEQIAAIHSVGRGCEAEKEFWRKMIDQAPIGLGSGMMKFIDNDVIKGIW